jgi:hypothetical protein
MNKNMSTYKQRTLDFLDIEWTTYVERFDRWPKGYGEERVKKQGYEQFRDMLAHILAWWDEGMSIILAIAEGREYPRKKYDFDAFNADAVEKYGTWKEAEFLAHFEKTRQNAAASLRSMNEAAWDDKRVQRWIHGVFIGHAREHLVATSRFLALDTLEHEWSTYVERFDKIDNKEAFLNKQGVETFHDLIAHIIGWWDVGAQIINGVVYQPGFTWTEPETDAFNLELTARFKDWSFDDLLKEYEKKRSEMIDLIRKLPDDAFTNKDVENWIAADVVEHFDDHAV